MFIFQKMPHRLVLIGRDRHEDGLVQEERIDGLAFHDDVQAGNVLLHRVQDDVASGVVRIVG